MSNDFDVKARDWDKNKTHHERSRAIAEAILRSVPVNRKMSAMEYGAGTGLLSFFLKDKFHDITLMDSSLAMIRVIKAKIIAEGATHMKVVHADLEKDDFKGSFDIIYNNMVLHHVIDIKGIINTFYSLLKPGGYIAIADLFSEDGSFHGAHFNGHKGFNTKELGSILKKAGFQNVKHHECYIIKKLIDTGVTKEFPIFVMTALK